MLFFLLVCSIAMLATGAYLAARHPKHSGRGTLFLILCAFLPLLAYYYFRTGQIYHSTLLWIFFWSVLVVGIAGAAIWLKIRSLKALVPLVGIAVWLIVVALLAALFSSPSATTATGASTHLTVEQCGIWQAQHNEEQRTMNDKAAEMKLAAVGTQHYQDLQNDESAAQDRRDAATDKMAAADKARPGLYCLPQALNPTAEVITNGTRRVEIKADGIAGQGINAVDIKWDLRDAQAHTNQLFGKGERLPDGTIMRNPADFWYTFKGTELQEHPIGYWTDTYKRSGDITPVNVDLRGAEQTTQPTHVSPSPKASSCPAHAHVVHLVNHSQHRFFGPGANPSARGSLNSNWQAMAAQMKANAQTDPYDLFGYAKPSPVGDRNGLNSPRDLVVGRDIRNGACYSDIGMQLLASWGRSLDSAQATYDDQANGLDYHVGVGINALTYSKRATGQDPAGFNVFYPQADGSIDDNQYRVLSRGLDVVTKVRPTWAVLGATDDNS